MIRCAAFLAALALSANAQADWDGQLSTRLLTGGGAWIAEQSPDPWPLFELALRADVLLGEAHPGVVRLGPAFDLRTEDFRTLEAGGGLAIFFPTGLGFGLTTTFAGGWGARPEDRDGAFGLAQIAIGYRPYNYFSAYAYAVNLYAGARVQLENERVWEVTMGLEVDLEFVSVIPFMFVYQLARGHDPDEPEPE